MKIWALPLLPFSLLYASVMRLRNWAYDRGWKKQQSIGIPVISIGNITIGGTGKTPMAEFLLEKLCAMGLQPAYLSRGYGRKTQGFLHVLPAKGNAALYGDEAFQVANRFPTIPVAVCEDRVAGAQQLLAHHDIDILVLDDAFQHRRIGRDLDWVMVDASRLPTEDWTLPAGRLREPLRGLGRAHTLIISKFKDAAELDGIEARLQKRFPKLAIAAFGMQPKAVLPFYPQASQAPPTLEALQGQNIIAFSGIGNNAHFARTLQQLGANLTAHFSFPDHFSYTEPDIEKILVAFESQKEIKGKLPPAFILTTEKDYFRLKDLPWMQRFQKLPLCYLAVGMQPVKGWEQMEENIKKIINEVSNGKYQ